MFLAQFVSDHSESCSYKSKFYETAHCANGSLIKILYSAVLYLETFKVSPVATT